MTAKYQPLPNGVVPMNGQIPDALVAQRLAERRICEEQHQHLRLPHTGFGWTGTRCSKCGFMFFGQWNENAGAMLKSVTDLLGAPAERLNF